MESKILAKRYAEMRKHAIGEVNPGELVIVPLENLNPSKLPGEEFYYRVGMVVRQRNKDTVVHSVGLFDTESENIDLFFNKSTNVIWLVESYYPITRVE